MEPKDYILTRIESEYAYIKDIESGNEVFIALALLPVGATIGSRLHFEMFEYTLMNWNLFISKGFNWFLGLFMR